MSSNVCMHGTAEGIALHDEMHFSGAEEIGKVGRNPVWSPDGSLIAYSGPNVFTLTPLLAVRPDGSPVKMPPIRTHRLTRLSGHAAMRTFDITPDGKQIVFDRLQENSSVVLIDLRTQP